MRDTASAQGHPIELNGAAGPHAAMAAPAAKHDNVPLGILYMVIGTVMLAASNAIAKWQVAIYPVCEGMFFRSFFSLVFCAIAILPFTGLSVLATHRPRDHMARGLSQAVSQTFTVIAI